MVWALPERNLSGDLIHCSGHFLSLLNCKFLFWIFFFSLYYSLVLVSPSSFFSVSLSGTSAVKRWTSWADLRHFLPLPLPQPTPATSLRLSVYVTESCLGLLYASKWNFLLCLISKISFSFSNYCFFLKIECPFYFIDIIPSLIFLKLLWVFKSFSFVSWITSVFFSDSLVPFSLSLSLF